MFVIAVKHSTSSFTSTLSLIFISFKSSNPRSSTFGKHLTKRLTTKQKLFFVWVGLVGEGENKILPIKSSRH